jgi:hypothetical protein
MNAREFHNVTIYNRTYHTVCYNNAIVMTFYLLCNEIYYMKTEFGINWLVAAVPGKQVGYQRTAITVQCAS